MDAVDLWREYERATLGRKALTWSPGLRRRLLGTGGQRTDEQIAEEEVGGVFVCAFSLDDWGVIDRLNLSTEILKAIEQVPLVCSASLSSLSSSRTALPRRDRTVSGSIDEVLSDVATSRTMPV